MFFVGRDNQGTQILLDFCKYMIIGVLNEEYFNFYKLFKDLELFLNFIILESSFLKNFFDCLSFFVDESIFLRYENLFLFHRNLNSQRLHFMLYPKFFLHMKHTMRLTKQCTFFSALANYSCWIIAVLI